MNRANSSPDQKIVDRKNRFDALNAFVSKRNGWVTSVPGAREITFEVLPDSPLPADLGELGYEIRKIGEGQRILVGAIVENFTHGPDGELQLLTEGSTLPVAETRTHAGIVGVQRYGFEMP